MADTPYKVADSTLLRRFRRREGDVAQEGANNTLIVLGTDRAKSGGGPATVKDGNGAPEKSPVGRFGAIHAVAGRVDPQGNPDLVNDDAYLYLSSDTNADDNIAATGVKGGATWADANSRPAAILRSENIRTVFGNQGDIRILSDGGNSFLVMNDRFIDWSVGNNFWLNVGGTLTEIRDVEHNSKIRMGPLVPGLKDLVDTLYTAIQDATVVSYTGNMGSPVPNNGDLKINLLGALERWRSSWLDMPYMRTRR